MNKVQERPLKLRTRPSPCSSLLAERRSARNESETALTWGNLETEAHILKEQDSGHTSLGLATHRRRAPGRRNFYSDQVSVAGASVT